MTLNATFIVILILSGYGLKSFIESISEKEIKTIAIVFGTSWGVIILVLLTYESFAFATPQEATQYDANTLALLKGVRKELLFADIKRLLIIMLITSGFVFAYLFKKISKELTVAAF